MIKYVAAPSTAGVLLSILGREARYLHLFVEYKNGYYLRVVGRIDRLINDD